MKNKQFILSTIIAFLSLFLVIIFPTGDAFQRIISGLVFFIVLPLLATHYLLKQPLSFIGLRNVKLSTWLPQFSIVSTVAFITLIGLLFLFNIYQYYPQPTVVSINFWFFLFYTVVLVGLFTLFYETFFRGFVMATWRKTFSYWTIIAQWLLFLLFLFVTGSLDWKSFPFIFVGLFSGYLAYRTRSLIPSFIFSWIFVILISVIIPYIFF